MRASRMWGVSGEPFTSLGRRGVHGAGLVVVFWVLSMAPRWSRSRSSLVATGTGRVFFRVSLWPQMRDHGHPTHVGSHEGSQGASR